MQQFLTHSNGFAFAKEVNLLLAEGWRVVPGTMYATSVVIVSDRDKLKLPDGTTRRMYYAVVLENEDVR